VILLPVPADNPTQESFRSKDGSFRSNNEPVLFSGEVLLSAAHLIVEKLSEGIEDAQSGSLGPSPNSALHKIVEVRDREGP
jgi:hypothetical protein